ncbi:uncharacterized protein [Henckelia pumila]|uniref:uncharacterized protein n=1 Tax=Henckelia pumila TaxID=405737 RepID=UPI003C6DD94E
MTARKLRPYFLSHPIVVLTNIPIGRILTRVDISARLVKWTTELSEYDIQYEPRSAIKAQALTDFLAETRHMEGEDLWKVYVDGYSNNEGCGVGVLLISPQVDEIRLAVRLDFRASKNESEYEAVLIGLRATKQAGAARVHLYSDSQLVAQQVNGSYEVKNEKLKEYMRAIEEARGLFDEVVVQVELTPSNELAPLAQEESDWRKELLEYMEKGELPKDPMKAYRLKQMSLRFVVVEGVLYKRSFSGPLLKCLGPKEAHYVLKEIHEGCCVVSDIADFSISQQR